MSHELDHSPSEDHPRSWLAYLLLTAMALLLGYLTQSYQMPGNGGGDDNGYLRTARMIVEDGALSFAPHHPLQYAGSMMVVAPNGRIYAKYPFGYPLLAAAARAIDGPDAMYVVNPVCTVLACFASFFFFRRLLGNFASLMGVILLACNPSTLNWANPAMSHASTLLCVVVGFWGIMRWHEDGKWITGLIGGIALGYAATIRYTEFLLVLPVGFAALSRINFNPRRWKQALPPLIGWAIPMAVLAIVCWHAYGKPWLTGYSLCKEQTGFGWKYFIGSEDGPLARQGNWETLLHQMNHVGLFLLWPAGMAGMVAVFWHNWRLASMLVLWVVPPTVLYMFYYWAPVGEDGVWYLRFFLTVFPALILTGLWVMDRAMRPHRHAAALALGAVTALASCFNLSHIIPQIGTLMAGKAPMVGVVREVRRAYPPPASGPCNVLLADETACGFLDAIGGYELYSLSMFRATAFQNYLHRAGMDNSPTSLGEDDPSGLQRARAVAYVKMLGMEKSPGVWVPKPSLELETMQMQVIDDALNRHLRVALLLRGKVDMHIGEDRSDLRVVKLGTWHDPPPVEVPPVIGMLRRLAMGLKPIPAVKHVSTGIKPPGWTVYEIVKQSPGGMAQN